MTTAHQSTASAENPPELVRLYNDGGAELTHDETKKGGQKHVLKPKQFANVPVHVAKLWMRMFPNNVILADSAEKSQAGFSVRLQQLEKQIADLSEANAKLVEENAELRAAKGGKGKR